MRSDATYGEDFMEYAVLEQSEEMDDSCLELLCEDGFLDVSDLSREDVPGQRALLLKKAIGRGFLPTGRDLEPLSEAVRLIVKRSDSLRHWKDVVKRRKYFRAPPFRVQDWCCCMSTTDS